MRGFAEIVAPEALAELGLSGAALDDEGDVAFEMSGHQVLLSYREAPLDALWVTVGVGPAPQGDHGSDPDALRWMLDTAGELWLSSGLTLGLDEPGKEVCCRFVIPTGLATAAGLAEAITGAITAAADMRETLASRRFGSRAAAGDGALPSDRGGFV